MSFDQLIARIVMELAPYIPEQNKRSEATNRIREQIVKFVAEKEGE